MSVGLAEARTAPVQKLAAPATSTCVNLHESCLLPQVAVPLPCVLRDPRID